MKIKTTTDLAILTALERGPLHGYAIFKALRTHDPQQFQKDAPLYPKLHLLQHAGHLTTTTTHDGHSRVTYALTEPGTRHLQQLRTDLEAHLKAVEWLRHPALSGTLT